MSERTTPGGDASHFFIVGEGLAEPIEHKSSTERPAREVVDLVIRLTQHAREDVLVFREDDDEPLEMEQVIAVTEASTLHVHRCRRIGAFVNYQDRTIEHHFSPATTIHRVLKWAVGDDGFNFAPEDAVKFELALPNETVPSVRDHVGQFARHPDCSVRFDLVEADKPQG